jgi:hypothetical protein
MPTGSWLALHAASGSVAGRSTRSLAGMNSTRVEGDLWSFDEELAASKRDRLSVRFIDAGALGFLFHELVWERRPKMRWKRHTTISQYALDPTGQWAALRIHSFDSKKAEAVVMLCEGKMHRNGKLMQSFGWFSLSLVAPFRRKLLRACNDPNERYAG